MKRLKPLAGYTLYDHKRNADIRTKLNMTPILDTIKNYHNNLHRRRLMKIMGHAHHVTL
ncbi:hypothetical protein C0J52_09278 [Blattella germanica]|nr:hypothetical protein C0J52_09278 [Blattella germanica]